eukprot:6837482-Prorocentrum_lima.AAC.1
MTSSLVGSEMCIRDRLLKQLAQCTYTDGHSWFRACLRIVMCSTLVTVSYTHLTLPTICSV